MSTLKYGYKEWAYPELITRINTGFCFMIVENSWHVMKVMQNDISIVNLIFLQKFLQISMVTNQEIIYNNSQISLYPI